MYSLVKNIFFKNTNIKTFFVTRLTDNKIGEKVFLCKGKNHIDISSNHGMICLAPFCIAVWLPADQMDLFDPGKVDIHFCKGRKNNALLQVSLIEKSILDSTTLLLYKIDKVKNYQFNPLKRYAAFSYLLRNKTSTYFDRKAISALYSYPRKIIVTSYKDDQYCNIFPMDIHGYIKEGDFYILGLRTTNVTLDKILEAKKAVVSDTDAADLDIIYSLGKHSGAFPPAIADLPFKTISSEIFKFPVPAFSASYKEIEIIKHKKMGYHMLLIGKIVNKKQLRPSLSSLYHIGFLQYPQSGYTILSGEF